MNSFKEFVNEQKSVSDTFEKFLSDVEKSAIKDFSMTPEQATIFIRQYEDLLSDSYKQGFKVREAIASTKKFGTLEK